MLGFMQIKSTLPDSSKGACLLDEGRVASSGQVSMGPSGPRRDRRVSDRTSPPLCLLQAVILCRFPLARLLHLGAVSVCGSAENSWQHACPKAGGAAVPPGDCQASRRRRGSAGGLAAASVLASAMCCSWCRRAVRRCLAGMQVLSRGSRPGSGTVVWSGDLARAAGSVSWRCAGH
jgi:hypothetical protein